MWRKGIHSRYVAFFVTGFIWTFTILFVSIGAGIHNKDNYEAPTPVSNHVPRLHELLKLIHRGGSSGAGSVESIQASGSGASTSGSGWPSSPPSSSTSRCIIGAKETSLSTPRSGGDSAFTRAMPRV